MSLSTKTAPGERQLVVSLKETVGPEFLNVDTEHRTRLFQLLGRHNAELRPLVRPKRRSVHGRHLARFHTVHAPDERLEALRDEIKQHPAIDAAYIKPAGALPVVMSQPLGLAPAPLPPAPTPNLAARQLYTAPAPNGIDVAYAWAKNGRGAGVQIIDCEWGWNLTHEDLQTHCRGVAIGPLLLQAQPTIDHGTAVAGILVADDDGKGITGIAPEATLRVAAFGPKTSETIIAAADQLSAGDILLLEIHLPGPNAGGAGEQGYIAIEWWPDDFHAIGYATEKGVIVVEPAGNGNEDLDDPVYDTPYQQFGSTWTNPFRLGAPSSGAIIVGAGNPPPGTHNQVRARPPWTEAFVDRARCGFSNFGSRVDCQSWGWEVTTIGYGDLQGGINSTYTDVFGGTSSASPIVAGALACVQSALRAANRSPLTPAEAVNLLRHTGSQQQGALGRPSAQRIGSRPDLRAMLTALGL